DLFQQGVHHLILGDVPDHFAALEDHAFAIAGRDTDVGLAGLARAVDDAAENTDFHRRLATVQPLLQVGHDFLKIDGQAAAGWGGDQLGRAYPALGRLQDVEGRLDLHLLVGQEADADGVADAVEQDRRQAAGRLSNRVWRLARLGDADVRRVIRLL